MHCYLQNAGLQDSEIEAVSGVGVGGLLPHLGPQEHSHPPHVGAGRWGVS